VPSPGRYHDPIATGDFALAPVDRNSAMTFLDAEELVTVLVHLRADVFSLRQTHQNQLEMLAGVEDSSEA
jgi:hypothetical protein